MTNYENARQAAEPVASAEQCLRRGEYELALTLVKEARAAQGETFGVLRVLGAAAMIVEDGAAVETCFQRAAALPGEQTRQLYLYWSERCFKAAHYHKARLLTGSLLKAASYDTEVIEAFVRYALADGRPEDAEAPLAVWLASRPDSAAPHVMKARIAFMHGDMKAAIASARRALVLDRDNLGALRMLASCRCEDLADGYLERFHSHPERRQMDARERAHLDYALGALYEAKGQCVRAFDRYVEANKAMTQEISRRNLTFDPRQPEQDQALLQSAVAASGYAAARRESDPAFLFILGMPRSGSTLVEQMLSMHPGVEAFGERQELIHWREEILRLARREGADAAGRHIAAHADEWRAGYIAAGSGRGVYVDKNLINFQASPLITAMFPNARIVWMRRDARDTALSIFASPFAPQANFTASMDHILSFAAYAESQRERCARDWADAFFEVGYEALVNNAEAYLRGILSLCGLSFDRACLRFFESRRVVNTVSAVQVRQPLYKKAIGRSRPFAGCLEPWFGKHYAGAAAIV